MLFLESPPLICKAKIDIYNFSTRQSHKMECKKELVETISQAPSFLLLYFHTAV